MNIANGTAAAISLQSLTKKTDGKTNTGAFFGKVIAKSGKEIQVLINDKVYKIEPGNAQNIKIGDKIQVFFGNNLPQEISEEMLKKISGKLIDVFSLSLPYKTTKELENLINQMPQSERLQFAKISNDMVQMTESILKEDFSILSDEASNTNKNSLNLFDANLPYNRRLVELTLKAKEMGKAWDQIPHEIKKEIIKKYVLFDLQKQSKGDQNTTLDGKNTANLTDKEGRLEKPGFGVKVQDTPTTTQKDLEIEGQKLDIKNKETDQESQMKNELKNNSQDKKPVSKSVVEDPFERKGEKSTHLSEKTNHLNLKNHRTSSSEVKITSQKEVNTEATEKPILNKKDSAYELFQNSKSETTSSTLKQVLTSFGNLQKNDNRSVQIPDKLEQASQYQHTHSNKNTSSTIHENMDNINNHGVTFSKEDIRLITTILQNSISKPLSLEKNLENFDKLIKSGKDIKMNVEAFENKEKQQHLSKDSDNILQLIKKLSSFENTTKSSSFTSFSEQKISFTEFSPSHAFEKIIQSPLMNVEIKNMINSFKAFGIPQKEANHTTLDIVNIATRSLKEETISTQLYSMALKKYLKLKLPQLIVNHKIDQKNESELISKIESFSKKAFIIIKAFTERLMTNRESEIKQSSVKTTEKEHVLSQLSDSKKTINQENSQEINKKNTNQLTTNDGEKGDNLKSNPDKENKGLTPRIPVIPKKETLISSLNTKKEGAPIQTNPESDREKVLPNENKMQTNSKSLEQISKNEYSSEKLIKFLNISSEKPDISNPYSSLISLNEQPFVIDFHHQKMDKGGYEKNEMYRVFIETNTQLFGTVFVDTVVSNKKIDIYIYAEEKYAKSFTNNSSTLIKRIKETDYDLRGLFIRERLDQNGILRLKVKQYASPTKEGGFHSLA